MFIGINPPLYSLFLLSAKALCVFCFISTQFVSLFSKKTLCMISLLKCQQNLIFQISQCLPLRFSTVHFRFWVNLLLVEGYYSGFWCKMIFRCSCFFIDLLSASTTNQQWQYSVVIVDVHISSCFIWFLLVYFIVVL